MTEFLSIESGEELSKYITKRIDKLNVRCIILQKKYTLFKKWYDALNIIIILLSTLLSITEALKIRINDTENERLIFAFEVIPLCMSSIITCTVAIIKLQKYQENMESMLIAKEKVILTKTKLREIQEFIRTQYYTYEDIKTTYMKEVYPLYNSCNEDLERNILFKDIVKYNIIIKNEEKNKEDEKQNKTNIFQCFKLK